MRAEQIANLLPAFWREGAHQGSPVAALFAVMADMIDPVERRIASLDEILDPARCSQHMLGFLARMLGFGALAPFAQEPSPQLREAALRAVLSEAAPLLDQRGTPQALRRCLTLAVGPNFSLVESTDTNTPFHVTVQCPAGTEPQIALIEAVVALMKPAHVTHSLSWAPPDHPTD